ncbi:hypothetical protein FA13DRAFT_1717383 [Coprinellus micaceus]|uniref:Uncharacterized protein n=1 Tax=Coprinellus micaceus TaxID=71717 RepID=A0A4Y7SGH9_COPMI|nr:hypothetical protein FA13DRAFT_1717383 [Coprinellus micaceus]
MPLKGSSFLCLLPYRTRALIDGHSLALHLPRDCIYVPWVHALQAYISNLNSNFAHPWGVYSPADILLDDRSCSLSSPASANIIQYDYGDCKLKSRVLRGLGALTTACLLYDMIVWMEGGKDLQCRVLQHARQDIVVGDWPIFKKLRDLPKLMTDFMRYGAGLASIAGAYANGKVETPPENDEFAQSMASEYSTLSSGKHAVTVVKNILYTAFTIRVMFHERQITIPEDALKASKRTRGESGLLTKDVFDLRRALLAALAISPLTALASQDLCNNSPCAEETILNCKHYGSNKPDAISSLERVMWREILEVSRGTQSAGQAFRNLHNEWADVDWNVTFQGCSGYFTLSPSDLPTSSFSLVDALVMNPIPTDWPIPSPSCVHTWTPPQEPSPPSSPAHSVGTGGAESAAQPRRYPALRAGNRAS